MSGEMSGSKNKKMEKKKYRKTNLFDNKLEGFTHIPG